MGCDDEHDHEHEHEFFDRHIPGALAQKLSVALGAAGLPSNNAEVSPATDARFGDYQSNAAMILAKQRGEKPRDVAQKIVEALAPNELFETPTIAGAGFINFTLRAEAVSAKTTQLLKDERLGVPRAEHPKKIIIDFSSPNVAKPMHIGHIRSTIIGDALSRIAEFLGHDVIRDNHIGDWGTQFGMVIWGWKNLLDRDALARDPIAELVRIYKETNARGTEDPAIREKCKEELVKLQAHEPENHAIWKECVDLSLGEFARTYELLDIRHGVQCGESFYNDRLAGVVDRLLAAGIAEESEARSYFSSATSPISRQADHRAQKRRRLELRHLRRRDRRLSRAGFETRHLLVSSSARPRRCISGRSSRSRAAKVTPPTCATSLSATFSAKTAS